MRSASSAELFDVPLLIIVSSLCLLTSPNLPAQPDPNAQESKVVTLSGVKYHRWYGHAGRSYFIQVSDPNHPLIKWNWLPAIEAGNDEEIEHIIGGTAPIVFFRLKYTDQIPGPNETLDTADFDQDGLTNLSEISPPPPLLAKDATDPLDPDSDDDGLTDGYERENDLDPNDPGTGNPDNGPNGDPDDDGLTNAEEQALGTDPKDADSDDDLLKDGEDAVPLDGEINWRKTTEGKYVWIEQVDELDPTHHRHQARAVNKHGQILFRDARFDTPLYINDQKNLWSSSTKEWVTLPLNGSQEIDIVQNGAVMSWTYHGVTVNVPPGQHVFNLIEPVYEFLDINDEGAIYGIAQGEDYGYLDPLIPGMFWKRSGTSLNQYAAPAYFYPQYPFPAPQYQHSIIDRTWTPWEKGTPGAIANDGTINSLASYQSNKSSWMTYDSQAAGASMQSIRDISGITDSSYTFPGAILDKDRALFVETLDLGPGVRDCRLWLKEETTQTDLSFMTPHAVGIAEMSLAPSKKTDDNERLWITTGPKTYLEKKGGGTGADRWHEPPSMAEGAILLHSIGTAFTAGIPQIGTTAAIPPKIWRNGKYTELKDVTSKPSTVTIDKVIDVASNGIVLVQATDGTVKKTGLLVPVEVEQEGYTSAKGIRFCRWLDSFTGNSLKSDCADKDRDRFRIRIPAMLPNLTKIHIKSTHMATAVIDGQWISKHTDGDYDVTLTEENGALVSTWMLLVGDGDDDVYYNGKGTDNGTNDQTLFAVFDSPIEVTLPEYQNAKVVFSAQKPLGDVEIQPYYLSPAGDVPPDMERFITNHLDKMKEIYRQIGVRVGHYGIVGKVVPQSWFDAKSAPSEVADYFTPSESNLARAAVRGMAVPGKQIRIGFVNATLMQDGVNPWDLPFRARGFTDLGTDGIIVSIELNDAREILGVTAHEVGHTFGLPHPSSNSWKRWLMRGGGGDVIIWNDEPLDSKRFQSGDFDIIRNCQSFYVPYVPN